MMAASLPLPAFVLPLPPTLITVELGIITAYAPEIAATLAVATTHGNITANSELPAAPPSDYKDL